ncbi:MAG: hypothetical protein CMO55_25175 [Verrucomicrobiales bacterium]|nr:hypothetical protein [Verrucomicrobiales bacterium]
MSLPKEFTHLFDKTDELCQPVIYWKGILYSLAKTAAETSHWFGGEMPPCQGIGSPATHRHLLTIDLEPFDIRLPGREKAGRLPCMFNFDLESLSTDYVVEGGSIQFDHPLAVFGADEASPDAELPYDSFPDTFPISYLEIVETLPIDFDTLQEHFTSQGLFGTFGEDDVSDRFFVILPEYKALKTSLWAAPDDPDAYLSAGNICIFQLDPTTGRVDASNQCT